MWETPLLCWEIKGCGRKDCPVYHHPGVFCWLVDGNREEEGKLLSHCLHCQVFKLSVERAIGRRSADLALYQTVGLILQQMKNSEEELKEKVVSLQILNLVTGALQSTTKLEEVLHIILTGVTAGEAFGFNRAFILLLDEKEVMLKGEMAVGPLDGEEAKFIWQQLEEKKPSLKELLFPSPESHRSDGLNSLVRRLSIPVHNPKAIGSSLVEMKSFSLRTPGELKDLEEEFVNLFGSQPMAIVPLVAKDKAIGVLIADNKFTQKPILDRDVELLETFAHQASLAIENSRLNQELKSRLRELEDSERQLRKNQTYLLKTERLAAIGRMAATVAHEIRSPLVPIGGYARAALEDYDRQEVKREDLEIIVEEVERLEKILANMLDYSKETKPALEELDLNLIVKKTLELMGERFKEKGVKLKTELSPQLPPVMVDGEQIQQVILNLVHNALEAMEEGRLSIRTKVKEDFVSLEVEDTGRGIPKEDIDRLFTPFFSTKPKGSGLGLPVAEKIVVDHGGFIDVQSEVGVGSKFTVNLPLKTTW